MENNYNVTVQDLADEIEVEVEEAGPKGDTGAPGVGVPAGGLTDEVLAKKSDADFDTEWKSLGAASAQNLAWNETDKKLSISNGNEVELTGLAASKDVTDLGARVTKNESEITALKEEQTTQNEEIETLKTSKLESVVQGTNIIVDDTDPLNPRISSIGGVTAEVVNRSYFTADEVITALATFYIANRSSKGTNSEAVQSVELADLEKDFFGQDLLGNPFPAGATILEGDYTGGSTVFALSDAGQYIFYIEVYVCDADGNPRDSGVTGQPTGDLGFQTSTILSSGIVGLERNENTQVSYTSTISEEYTLAAGERHRFHVGCEKVDTQGGAIIVEIKYGTLYDSFIQVPFVATTDNIINATTLPGATSSDVLMSLDGRINTNTAKLLRTAYKDEENTFTEDQTLEKDLILLNTVDSENADVVLVKEKADGAELLVNGDFEDGSTGWTNSSGVGEIGVIDGEAFIGASGTAQQIGLNLEVSKVYKLSIEARVSSVGTMQIEGVGGSLPIITTALTQNMVQYITEFIPTIADTGIRISEIGGSSNMILDNVALVEEAVGSVVKQRVLGSAAFEDKDDLAYKNKENSFTENNAFNDGTTDFVRTKKETREVVGVNSDNEEVGAIPYVLTNYIEGQKVPKNTIVFNGNEQMISLVETSDYPFINSEGQPAYSVETFPSSGTDDSTVVCGNQWLLNHDIAINEVLFFSSSVSDDARFSGYLRIFTNDPEDGITYSFSGLPLAGGQTLKFPIATKYALAGQTVQAYLLSTDNSTNTEWTLDFTYTGAASAAVTRGEANTSPNRQLLRVSYYDSGDNYIQAQLAQITVGSYIRYEQLAEGAYELYQVVELRDPDGDTTSFVANLVQSSATDLVDDEPMVMRAEIPDATGSTYDYQTDGWVDNVPSWADNAEGMLKFGGADVVLDANAYACDIKAVGITKSVNWQVMIVNT